MPLALFTGRKTRLDDAQARRGRRTTARRPVMSRHPLVEQMEGRQLLTYMSINSFHVTEGTGGTTPATFTVTLTPPSAQTVTVNYQTADGTAKAGSDYIATQGTLTFKPGQTSATVTVQVIGDSVAEPTEAFGLKLTGATNATCITPQGMCSIVDDDTAVTPLLSINDVSMYEGNSGTTQMVFTVSLNTKVLDKAVTVTLKTQDATATAGSDYAAKTEVLTFNPGETVKQFSVTIYGDTQVENNEAFFVVMSNANVGFNKANGAGMILNDDVA